MKYRILTALVILAFALNAVASGPVANSGSPSNELAQLLPASDGVITLDSNRLFNEALPLILSANPTAMKKINQKLDQLESETGVDLRNFKQVAVGIKAKVISGKKVQYQPVILARGEIDSKGLIAVARLVSNGTYTTEKIGSRTIYIFSAEEIIEKNKPKADDKKDEKSFLEKGLDSIIGGLSNEIALTAYDEHTVAIGTPARVRELIGKSPRVDAAVLNLLNRKSDAVANMGAILPDGVSKFIKLGNDELGKTLDSIRQLQGSLTVADEIASVSVMAKTLGNDDAENLHATLTGFQILGKAIFGNSTSPDKQVYARVIENADIKRDANAVMLELSVPKSDIDILVGKK